VSLQNSTVAGFEEAIEWNIRNVVTNISLLTLFRCAGKSRVNYWIENPKKEACQQLQAMAVMRHTKNPLTMWASIFLPSRYAQKDLVEEIEKAIGRHFAIEPGCIHLGITEILMIRLPQSNNKQNQLACSFRLTVQHRLALVICIVPVWYDIKDYAFISRIVLMSRS